MSAPDLDARVRDLDALRHEVRRLLHAFLGRALLHGVPNLELAESWTHTEWALSDYALELLVAQVEATAHPFAPTLARGLRAARSAWASLGASSLVGPDRAWEARREALRAEVAQVRDAWAESAVPRDAAHRRRVRVHGRGGRTALGTVVHVRGDQATVEVGCGRRVFDAARGHALDAVYDGAVIPACDLEGLKLRAKTPRG